MNPVWVAFTCGWFLGGVCGVAVMCLMIIAKQSDERFEETEECKDCNWN
jgi:hypothetical protein